MTKKLIAMLLILLFCTLKSPSFSGEKLTISFYQAKLSFVLQALSKKTGIKMITSSELGGKTISAYLENVDGEEAIDAILKANGLYREKMEGTDVYVIKEFKETPFLKSQTFFLQYAKATDLKKVLTPLLSPKGVLLVDKRTNSLTIKDTPESIKTISNIITSIDKSIPQVAIEAVLVELTTDGVKDLGIRWNLEGSFFGAAKDVAYPFTKEFTRDVVSPRTGTTTTTGTENPQLRLGTISFQTLTANLKILEEKGEANILASPRITTLNDSPATIKITKNMAVSPKVTETPEAGRIVTEYEYKEVGVSLKVIPHVNEKGYITLEVEPMVSSASKSTVFPDAVDTFERTAKTSVMVKNGETLVIGGLLRTDVTQSKGKVPLLGDIFPFLFKNKFSQRTKTDLVMFLTPRIITETEAKVIAEQEKKKMKLKEKKVDVSN